VEGCVDDTGKQQPTFGSVVWCDTVCEKPAPYPSKKISSGSRISGQELVLQYGITGLCFYGSFPGRVCLHIAGTLEGDLSYV